MAAVNLILLTLCALLWILMRAPVSCVLIPENHQLYSALHKFEVLHKRHLTHHPPPHIKSSPSHLTPSQRGIKHIHFRTLDRDFNLILTPSHNSLHQSVHISIVTGGRQERRPFPFPHFYTGYLLGTEDSHVVAHLHPDTGILTATIQNGDKHFYIEPSSRHFNESHDFHMIAYEQSHVKYNLTGHLSQHFCNNPVHQSEPSSDHHHQSSLPWQQPYFTKNLREKPTLYSSDNRRLKRALAGDVCTLHLVVTPSFHDQYSSGDPDTTTLFLLQVLSDIDLNIYKETDFESPYSNLGLVVTNITVYTDYSSSNPPYSMDRESDSEKLLQSFSRNDWTHVCLAHLFSAKEFADNRLGVAYVASRKQDDTGGICSQYVKREGTDETANVGISSYRNTGNRLLLLAEARLVTAHEIGHGWGSEHDPVDVRSCNPPLGRSQGKFLMFPSATDGDQENNDRFSPCSISMISDVVKEKGSCFQERSQLVGRCGNYQIEEEEGEECDAGALGKVGSDSCCTEDCKLRVLPSSGQAVECSDVNHACCKDCSVLSPDSDHVCMRFSPGNRQCFRDVMCAGDKDCPQNLTFDLRYVEPQTECGKEGQCLPGDSECDIDGNCSLGVLDSLECWNFCQWHGLEECFCTGDDECRFCCLQSNPETGNATCRPFRDSLRPDRSSCVGGFCEDGQCHPASQDLIQRLFELFDNPDINTLVQFMRENIVGTILFLTAIIWIPTAFFIHLVDIYRWREHKRVALEYEQQLQDAEIQDEEDLIFYDDVFEDMAINHPGVLRPEAKLGLMRMDSLSSDCFGEASEGPHTPLFSPTSPLTPSRTIGGAGGMGWAHRLSTITEESHQLNPERDNILAYVTPRNSFADGSKVLSEDHPWK